MSYLNVSLYPQPEREFINFAFSILSYIKYQILLYVKVELIFVY